MANIRKQESESEQPIRLTRADELRQILADEIVRGKLMPGDSLDETAIANRFSVSRTPVREAIRQLAASGLVDAKPHRAAIVAWPAHDELIGMFEIMAELEGLCAYYAAERMTAAERTGLEKAHEDLRLLIQEGDPQNYHETNQLFHGTVYAGAHNTYLAELTTSTRIRVQPFRRAQFRNLGRLAKSHDEHDRVVTAIMRADSSAAQKAMRDHIMTVFDEYEAYLASLATNAK
jgi:DNA-binding GntR family transcriptional regulator